MGSIKPVQCLSEIAARKQLSAQIVMKSRCIDFANGLEHQIHATIGRNPFRPLLVGDDIIQGFPFGNEGLNVEVHLGRCQVWSVAQCLIQ